MARLEDRRKGAAIRGILADSLVTVVDVRWYGSAAIELTYKDPAGKPNVVLLYRDREPTLEVVEVGRPWSFDGDGKLFRLVSEAQRIHLAYTIGYKLSDGEAALYKSVTDYVREDFNRADALGSEGRKGTVGFALTILQRRLASSSEAIYQSLRRRRERLVRRLREEQILRRGAALQDEVFQAVPSLTDEEIDELDDAPDAEIEQTEETVVDQATAARTIAELEAEIAILRNLEALALKVRRSGTDKKWEELSTILQHQAEMFDAHGHRRKLVLFTEHRDRLNYLGEKLRALLGTTESVVTVHGGMGREERTKAQEAFQQDKDILILLATDAAGEGINLQRAHLMVNYDLPWNPNRLEQRFGRIHRIGQTEVCHLWNLLAEETREGDVYKRLLEKIEQEREALGGGVFDILGQLFRKQRLRDLLIEAIRYGDSPEVRARLYQIVDNLTDRQRCQDLLEQRALAEDSMDASQVQKICEEMERAEARRLQPHFIESFFLEAFRNLGGSIKEREPRRYEITHVPALSHRSHPQLRRRQGAGPPASLFSAWLRFRILPTRSILSQSRWLAWIRESKSASPSRRRQTEICRWPIASSTRSNPAGSSEDARKGI